MEQLAAAHPDISSRGKSSLKKIALVATFSVDASFDVLQLNVRAMAANMVALRNVWLRNWEVGIGSQFPMVGVSFQGVKPFRQAFDPILVENK